MNKQAVLECVLDEWLTTRQLETIRREFPEFYENPYGNYAMADVVRGYLAGRYAM